MGTWRDYAVVPKRGQPTYVHNGRKLRIRIVAIRAERLHEITESDAIAEGVSSVAKYRQLWRK